MKNAILCLRKAIQWINRLFILEGVKAMRGILLLLVVFLSLVNCFLLVSEKPAKPEKIEIRVGRGHTIVAEPATPIVEEKVQEPVKPEAKSLPKPVVILNLADLSKIDDPILKAFVLREAQFRNEKVLYFVWEGKVSEKLQGRQIPEEKRYAITLVPGFDSEREVTHRQIFIVPENYDYSVEAAK